MSTPVPPGPGQPDPERPSEGFTQPVPAPPPPSAGGYGAPPPPSSAHPPAAPPPAGPPPAGPPPPASNPFAQSPTPPDQSLGSFFGRLFDLSFRTFVTPSVVKILYVLAIVLIALGWLFFGLVGFRGGAIAGIFTLLIVGPLYSLFMLILVRVTLEFYIAIIRVAEDVNRIKDRV